jgi:hypothetical protein
MSPEKLWHASWNPVLSFLPHLRLVRFFRMTTSVSLQLSGL